MSCLAGWAAFLSITQIIIVNIGQLCGEIDLICLVYKNINTIIQMDIFILSVPGCDSLGEGMTNKLTSISIGVVCYGAC